MVCDRLIQKQMKGEAEGHTLQSDLRASWARDGPLTVLQRWHVADERGNGRSLGLTPFLTALARVARVCPGSIFQACY